MKRNLWFTTLLVVSLLVVSLPTLAVEPAATPAEDAQPMDRLLGEQRPTLPGAATIKGESSAPAAPAPADPDAPTGILLAEGFEGGVMPPPDWSVVNNHPTRNWTITNNANYVRTGDYAAWVNYDTPTASDEWLYTPVIDLTGVPDAFIEFWAISDTDWCPSGGSGATMKLHVTDASDTVLATIWDMCNDENWAGDLMYRQVTKDLSAYADQQIKLAWQYVGIDGQSFGLDDVALLGSGGTPVVTMEPNYQKGLGDPNTVVRYDVTLWNFTNQTDSFDISYSGNVWGSTGPTTVGPVANNGSTTFQVEVTIPSGATCPDCDLLTVGAQAQASPVASTTVTIETCVGEDWQTESNTNAPGAHWMAYTCTDSVGAQGACFYFGGLASGNSLTAYSQKYDIASGTWTQIADLPTPVFAGVAGYIDGKVYVAGGFTGTPDPPTPWPVTGALQVYDVAGNTWSTGPALPIPRGGASGGVVGGKFYVAGGQDQTYEYRYLHEYDPVANAWTEKAGAPDFFELGAGTASATRLYVGGGYSGGNGFYEYDPGIDTWEEKAVLPGGAGKKSPVMVAAPDCGGVFLYGGDLGSWSGIQKSTWYWHPAANVWIDYGALLNTPTTGAGGGLAYGKLWSFAGSGGSGPIDPPPHESLAYCCPAAPPAGNVEGVVTDANTGQPLENANLFLSRPDDPDFEDSTWTNNGGYYSFGPLLAGDYHLRAAALGYYNESADITIVSDGDLAQNFVLDASNPELSPPAVGLSLLPDDSGVYALTLDNQGTGELTFHVSELPADSIYPTALDAPSGVDPALSADMAQSADGAAPFVVYMAEQADLSEAFALKDRSARGWYVLNELRATAQRSQAGLRAELERSGIEYESRYIINALVVEGDLALAASIAARPEVAYVGVDNRLEAPEPVLVEDAAVASPEAIEWNIAKIGADKVWTDPTFGTKGEGIVVANIDTGVQWDHPALLNQYRGGVGGNHDYNWWDPYGDRPTVPGDPHGHGTHTMGTMLGDDGAGNQVGVAPGATWFACNGFKNGGSGYEAELLECAEFVLAPWDLSGANPDPDRRADVVNNSWGGGQAQWWYNQIIYAWRAAGIFGVFSAGNSGPECETLGDPGDMVNILAVGATDLNDSNAPGAGASFSSRGPAKISGLVKPNVSAPGANIRSSVPGNNYEGGWGGTSMAAPHVSGEVALIWAAQPDLKGNVQLTQWIIEQTSEPLVVNQGYYCGADTAASRPNNQYGWGRIDAYEAVSASVNANWDIDWLTVAPLSGTVAPAGSAEIRLDFDSTGLTSGQCYNGHLKVEYNAPYVTEQFVPVALCVDICLGLNDVSISGPAWVYADHEAEYLAILDPVTATLPITIEWNNGATGASALYSWTMTGTQTIVVTGTNCGGASAVTRTLQVEAYPVHTFYLPLIYKNY